MKPTTLFNDFTKTSAAAWKQKIQFQLKGQDYNKTLLSETEEGITIKPFYTSEDIKNYNFIETPKKSFSICQSIFIDDEKIANAIALDALERGAESIQFIAKAPFEYKRVLKKINLKGTTIYFKFHFLKPAFVEEVSNFINSAHCYFYVDIIGNLAANGNWFYSLNEDFKQLGYLVKNTPNVLGVHGSLYQNAGATIVQQLAYSLAHGNEYLNHFKNDVADKIHFTFSVGSNYFFEIAKLRAFRILWKTLLKNYDSKNENLHVFVEPSIRNKTIYDYNVNMLRTTTECMSAIFGGANTVNNLAYDVVFHKANEFGDRIARNQLLILQQENYLKDPQNFADGSYYIESLTNQLAEKALILFKQIEKGGGFLKQLKAGTIQRKIEESATKEQAKFNASEIVLLGTNLQPNNEEMMSSDLELYPFLKQRNSKTLITPILIKRLSETQEQERLKSETKNE